MKSFKKDEENCNCKPSFINPVCASDGRTYQSECFVACANVHSEEFIRPMYQGQCDSEGNDDDDDYGKGYSAIANWR